MGVCLTNNNEDNINELMSSTNNIIYANERKKESNKCCHNIICYCKNFKETISEFLYNDEKEKLELNQKFSQLKNDIFERQKKLRSKKKENSEAGNIMGNFINIYRIRRNTSPPS